MFLWQNGILTVLPYILCSPYPIKWDHLDRFLHHYSRYHLFLIFLTFFQISQRKQIQGVYRILPSFLKELNIHPSITSVFDYWINQEIYNSFEKKKKCSLPLGELLMNGLKIWVQKFCWLLFKKERKRGKKKILHRDIEAFTNQSWYQWFVQLLHPWTYLFFLLLA